ncbi:hypothetical protein JS528_01045 [Bifidobacterium sp. MA2]|uniref:Uridine kinase n=1 Tax=Bifidobacterium santillanense TaxID=2809028 RepID=A0ABS5UM29_9BIFI|nr:hypothetical protein [Bifidobacterium santillanense]MBT1171966.1 hypothetical protein [Bifidobacterium santillanense]
MIRISEGGRTRSRTTMRLMAVMTASAMTLALAACSSTTATGQGNTTGDSGDGTVSSAPGNTGTDTTNGCADAPDGAGCEAETSYPVTTVTRRFVACLVSKGFDARVVGERNDRVALLEIDAAGNPKQPRLVDNGDGTLTRDWTTDPNLYPNIMSTGTISTLNDDFPYVIARDSADLAGSPYATQQQDYAACEQANPDFAQGVQRFDPDDANAPQEDKTAVLAFARDARAKGFDWVADPTADRPLGIVIPTDVPESEVRRFLTECQPGDAPVAYSWIGDYPYDIHTVMRESIDAR